MKKDYKLRNYYIFWINWSDEETNLAFTHKWLFPQDDTATILFDHGSSIYVEVQFLTCEQFTKITLTSDHNQVHWVLF